MSTSQVIDCGSVPVPWKTWKVSEKNTVNEAVFERELCAISAGIHRFPGEQKLAQIPLVVDYTLYISRHSNRHSWHGNQAEAKR
jgi:hypothetical protein